MNDNFVNQVHMINHITTCPCERQSTLSSLHISERHHIRFSGLLGLLILLLDWRQGELVAGATRHSLPVAIVGVGIPGQQAKPGLDVVVQLEGNILCVTNLAAWMGDLVFRFLVLELEETPVHC